MRHALTAAIAGALTLSATASMAADLTPAPPPPPPCIPRGSVPPGVVPAAPYCAEEFSGWYLRGDIGMTNQSVGKMHQALEDVITEHFGYSKSFDSSPFFGIGIGYRWNDWLRTDITAEYRGKANLHATAFGDQGSIDELHGSKSEFTTLANAYLDLGTWYNLTPFIGAGIGASYNRIHDFYDQCAALACSGQITAVADGTGAKWSLAWALQAGVGYEIAPGLTVEVAYRYLDLGDAQSGWFHNINPAISKAPGPYQFQHLTSQDIKFGLRWALGGGPAYAPFAPATAFMPAPSYVPPEPVTAPQPNSVYTPPEPGYESYPTLHRRG